MNLQIPHGKSNEVLVAEFANIAEFAKIRVFGYIRVVRSNRLPEFVLSANTDLGPKSVLDYILVLELKSQLRKLGYGWI